MVKVVPYSFKEPKKQRNSKTIEREIKDNYPKFVVSMDEFSGNSRNGINHFNLLEFLGSDLEH